MPAFGWRWLLALSSLPSFALLLFYPVTLESPRYLCMKGRIAEAAHVLETMARVNRVTLPSGRLVSGHRTELHEMGDSSETAQLVANKKNDTGDLASKSEIGGLNAILKLLSPNLIRSSLLLWTVFLGHAFLYYGLVLLTSELNHGNRICGSDEGAEVTTTAHINDENLYRNVFITSFGGMCVISLCSTKHLQKQCLGNYSYLGQQWCRGPWAPSVCGHRRQDGAQAVDVFHALHQLPVHSSTYVHSDRSSDNCLFIRCTGLHLSKLHCPAHLRP